jgi:hypothetical protein
MCKVCSHYAILRTANEGIQRNVRNDGLMNVPSIGSTYQEVKVKIKQSRYRPGMAQRVPGSQGSQIS